MAPTSIKYIDSTSKNFYRSEFVPVKEDGRIEIPLRGRMRVGGSAPHYNRHSDNQGKNRPPGPKRGLHNIPPKVCYMADAYKGHTVMLPQDEFFARTGHTELGFN